MMTQHSAVTTRLVRHGEGLRRARVGVILLTVLLAAGGCQTVGPVYELDVAKPTLVMVDDLDMHFGGPMPAEVIATRIRHDLTSRTKIQQVIPASELAALRSELGDAYRRTPIDRVGKELGAGQVIHVDVKSVQTRAHAGLLHPQAVVAVKVIDVAESRRIFPDSSEGFVMRVEMPMRALYDTEAAAIEPQLRERLSEKIGRDVARLFYKYDMRNPDERDRSLGDIGASRPSGR